MNMTIIFGAVGALFILLKIVAQLTESVADDSIVTLIRKVSRYIGINVDSAARKSVGKLKKKLKKGD